MLLLVAIPTMEAPAPLSPRLGLGQFITVIEMRKAPGIGPGVRTENLNPDIVVMKSAKDRA